MARWSGRPTPGARGLSRAGEGILLGALMASCAATPPSRSSPGTTALPTVVAVAITASSSPTASVATPTPTASPTPVELPGEPAGLAAAAPGVAFTGRLLIADRGNGRLLEIRADGSVDWMFPTPGQPQPVPFGAPDDAFSTQNGRTIIANAEESQTVTAIDRASGVVLWQVGHDGVRGQAPGYFNEPDDAVPAVDGTIWVADIRNCRLVHLGADGAWLGTRGDEVCAHAPPTSFNHPNGAFPARDGSLIVTEITGRRVTWLNPDATVRWSVRTPALYPSDALPYPDGSVLLTDYSPRGGVFRLDAAGTVLWKYRPRGVDSLDHPSIAIPLASNRVAICDDFHHRIVVVDPTSNAVVWTFTGQGSTQLSFPDGLDYQPLASDNQPAPAPSRRPASRRT